MRRKQPSRAVISSPPSDTNTPYPTDTPTICHAILPRRSRSLGFFRLLRPGGRRIPGHEAPVLVLVPDPPLALANGGMLSRHGVARRHVGLKVGLGALVSHFFHALQRQNQRHSRANQIELNQRTEQTTTGIWPRKHTTRWDEQDGLVSSAPAVRLAKQLEDSRG